METAKAKIAERLSNIGVRDGTLIARALVRTLQDTPIRTLIELKDPRAPLATSPIHLNFTFIYSECERQEASFISPSFPPSIIFCSQALFAARLIANFPMTSA